VPNVLSPCTQYRVNLDTARQMQKDSSLSPFVFANDSGVARSPCPLTWFSPINEATLYGIYPATIVGDAACSGPFCSAAPLDPVLSDGGTGAPRVVAPELKGKTIADIVGSFTTGRSDGLLCSSCHYTGSKATGLGKYLPPVKAGFAKEIRKDQRISYFIDYGDIESSGKEAWSDARGWAQDFVDIQKGGAYFKPASLRELFS